MNQPEPIRSAAPSVWIDGGRGAVIRWDVAQTSLGAMLVAATEKGVCRLSFGEDPAALARRFPNAERVRGGGDFAALLAEIVQAAEAPGETDFAHIPVDVRERPFRRPSGRRCAAFPRARRVPMPSSPPTSAAPARCARPVRPTGPTTSRC